MRINQFLARSGVASRRKAEILVLEGKVTLNGVVVKELSTNVRPDIDLIEVNGTKVALPELKYYLLNKPSGYTCTRLDRHAKKTIFELLPKDESLISVGRLDKDTAGLILITNDGHFAQSIIHPSKKVEKEYAVKLQNPNNESQIEKLMSGVELEDGPAKAKAVKKISDKEISLVIEEGRNRIVRRMIKAAGNEVVELRRDRIGSIIIDVPIGKYRTLTQSEIKDYV